MTVTPTGGRYQPATNCLTDGLDREMIFQTARSVVKLGALLLQREARKPRRNDGCVTDL